MNKQKTVLVVDSDHDVAFAVATRLKAAGYRTITECDGERGIDAAIKQHPDAIVMDLRGNKSDGLKALQILQQSEATRDIPVVMLSTRIHEKQNVLDAGANFFLPKPYRGSSLVQAVSVAIDEVKPKQKETNNAV